MCGIAGFFGRTPRSQPLAQAMLQALAARGPDAQHIQYWDRQGTPAQSATGAHALLHARLSIMDPRPEADQPMTNPERDIWICYNGEVYGWQNDAKELAELGFTFRTHSDTEFILYAYQAWGIEGVLTRLRGMFALVIVDWRQRKVLLARDRMGEKPLVYSYLNGELAFGSLVRSVLPWLPQDQRIFAPESIDAYLAHRYIPAPRTVFTHIQRLENGHWLSYDLDSGQLEKRCYWHPEATEGHWQTTLDEAIAIRTIADRPLGIFLSSGIDSSAIACRLKQQNYPALQTFTARFAGSGMDESQDAAAIANTLGLPNQAIDIPAKISQDFTQIIADLDEPFADPSSFPIWYLAQATTQQVKVVLAGDGGDEVFAGYKRIAKHLRSRWRAGLRLPFPRQTTPMSKGWKKLLGELSIDWLSAYCLRFSGFTPAQRAYLQADFVGQTHYWRLPPQSRSASVHSLLAIDMANYLPEYILRKSDLCTMAHGLESRAPLLDHHWYQQILNVPDAIRFTSPAKQILRPQMSLLDDMNLFFRKKKGFNPPLQQWLQHDLSDRLTGLGKRLEELSHGQLSAARCDELVTLYATHPNLAEQILQLLILDESLAQLRKLSLTSYE